MTTPENSSSLKGFDGQKNPGSEDGLQSDEFAPSLLRLAQLTAYPQPEQNLAGSNSSARAEREPLTSSATQTDAIQCSDRGCHAEFHDEDELKRHVREAHPQRKRHCGMGIFRVLRKQHLTQHLDMHIPTPAGEKPYNCGVCDQSFARDDVRTRHRKIHTRQQSMLQTSPTAVQDSAYPMPSVSPHGLPYPVPFLSPKPVDHIGLVLNPSEDGGTSSSIAAHHPPITSFNTVLSTPAYRADPFQHSAAYAEEDDSL